MKVKVKKSKSVCKANLGDASNPINLSHKSKNLSISNFVNLLGLRSK